MFGSLLSVMTTAKDTADSIISRRQHIRRHSDACVCDINGKTYPVLNWSLGGIQITADDRLFGIGQDVPVTLKFKIRSAITEVTHNARVVRKNPGKVAFQFEPLTRQARNAFQNIIDDTMASEFADSQV